MIVQARAIQSKRGLGFVLRSPLSGEAALLLEHLRITHRESYRNLNRDADYWEAKSVEQQAAHMKSTEESPQSFFLCAFHEGRIVAGLGLSCAGEGAGALNAKLGLSVQRAFCNSGLGTELMTLAEETARSVGFHRLELTVRTYNLEGIALYEKLGFRRVGVLREVALIDGELMDEFFYEKLLRGSRTP